MDRKTNDEKVKEWAKKMITKKKIEVNQINVGSIISAKQTIKYTPLSDDELEEKNQLF